MIDALATLPIDEPDIDVDLEGKNLGRNGPLYLAIVHNYKPDHTYIVDVHCLQNESFDIRGRYGAETFRSILESADIPKLFYDVCQDSGALYHQFRIKLDGILDVQLFKLAATSRSFEYPARYRTGLLKAIYSGIDMTYEAKEKWMEIKRIGKALWNPNQGGSWDRFTERNKCKEIIECCLVDCCPSSHSLPQGRQWNVRALDCSRQGYNQGLDRGDVGRRFRELGCGGSVVGDTSDNVSIVV